MKAGNKVVCINNSSHPSFPEPKLKKDAIYTVESVTLVDGLTQIRVVEDKSMFVCSERFTGKRWWSHMRFRIVDENFTNELTKELAEKVIHTDEEFAKEQEEQLNPRIFTTEEEF